MESSLFKAVSNENTVFKGHIGSVRECVTGRLFFVIKKRECGERFDIYERSRAKIAVGRKNELETFFFKNENLDAFVAAVAICDTENESVLLGIENLKIPILTLSQLSDTYDGKIAILDVYSESLFVDPDIDAVDRYTRELEKKRVNRLEFYAPVSYTAFSRNSEKSPIGVLHICSAGMGGEMRSEDELFDDYRALCESVRPIPITLMLCPAFPFNIDSKERFTAHIKAIFRASVYGETRILCGGPCTATFQGSKMCLDEIEKIKTVLKTVPEEKTEINSDVPCGSLVSTPLTLFSLINADIIKSTDFIYFDLNKLFCSILGDSWHDCLRKDAVKELLALLKRAILNSTRVTNSVCVIADKEIEEYICDDKALFAAIDKVFVKIEEK